MEARSVRVEVTGAAPLYSLAAGLLLGLLGFSLAQGRPAASLASAAGLALLSPGLLGALRLTRLHSVAASSVEGFDPAEATVLLRRGLPWRTVPGIVHLYTRRRRVEVGFQPLSLYRDFYDRTGGRVLDYGFARATGFYAAVDRWGRGYAVLPARCWPDGCLALLAAETLPAAARGEVRGPRGRAVCRLEGGRLSCVLAGQGPLSLYYRAPLPGGRTVEVPVARLPRGSSHEAASLPLAPEKPLLALLPRGSSKSPWMVYGSLGWRPGKRLALGYPPRGLEPSIVLEGPGGWRTARPLERLEAGRTTKEL